MTLIGAKPNYYRDIVQTKAKIKQKNLVTMDIIIHRYRNKFYYTYLSFAFSSKNGIIKVFPFQSIVPDQLHTHLTSMN